MSSAKKIDITWGQLQYNVNFCEEKSAASNNFPYVMRLIGFY